MTHVQQLLLACLHQDPQRLTVGALSSLDAEGWRDFLALVKRLRLRPLVYQRLSAVDARDLVPPGVLRQLHDACKFIARRNLLLHAELARLVNALQAEGIPVILLKGAHVATALYGNVALREMGDLDLMVRREHLERAAALVLEMGYAPKKPFSIDVDVAVSQHVSVLFRPPMFAVELHWNLTEPRQRYAIEPSELWARAVPVQVPGASALGLSREDLLLHLCVHTAYQHRFEWGLQSLCDLAELLEHRPLALDWSLVRERADRWGWSPGVELVLQLVTDLLGGGIPESAAFHPSLIAPDIAPIAAMHLLSSDPALTPARGIALLGTRRGLSAKLRHFGRMVFLPSVDLRRKYPRVPTGLWGWWVVYLLRTKDLLKRQARMLVRLGVARNRQARGAFERQRRLLKYLAEH